MSKSPLQPFPLLLSFAALLLPLVGFTKLSSKPFLTVSQAWSVRFLSSLVTWVSCPPSFSQVASNKTPAWGSWLLASNISCTDRHWSARCSQLAPSSLPEGLRKTPPEPLHCPNTHSQSPIVTFYLLRVSPD